MTTLRVPGASIFYTTQGAGPPLLIIPGGDGDADTCSALVGRLSDRFTIIAYDRRGMSRSTWDASPGTVNVATHADDVRRLLAAAAHEPAYVFGTSLGALIGLELCTTHPHLVRKLLAHEPPLPQVLAPPERAAVIADQERIEDVFASDGLDAAMRALVAATGIDVSDREAGVTLPRPDAQRRRNLAYMLTVDTPAARNFRLDLSRLAAPVVVGGGATSGDGFPVRCARALAQLLGHELVEFPGGHTGYVTHPTAFATALMRVLLTPI